MYRPGSTKNAEQPYLNERMQTPASPLPFPTEAIIDASNEPVMLLQTCDWPGHSPSSVGVDRAGKLFIGSFSELTVTDARVLPNELGYTIRARRQSKVAGTTTGTRGRKPVTTPKA